ncbi:TetR/AcrR family transcriptional regulator [Tersicoccus sp. Bi-70]|uniref:TetR/AcrR family transcriptional regulator n=1 Tax=Tersicoccus sp. Bi-70 TaxID=1897634 RepID=UPI0009F8DCDC|nr:TetR/AcrR family transcriptional regulator [Tersicoccus sp. Bi-70]
MSTPAEHNQRRDARMRRTRRNLISRARELTTEHGLLGFTVEQLCEDVGISRRTFFNYFASKDDAVIGTPARNPLELLGEEFVARGPAGGDLVDDVSDLISHSFANADDPTGPARLMTLIRHEPVLAERVLTMMQSGVAELAELIRRRVDAPLDDPFPGLAAAMLSHLAGYTMHRFMELHAPRATGHPVSPSDFDRLLDQHVRLAAELFSRPSTTIADDPKDTPS